MLEVFKAFKESFNLVSDSAYEIVGPIRPTSPMYTILLELQKLIWKRTHKFFIQHIRAHSTLPGPMAERNALVDASTRMEFIFHATPLELAKDIHQLYHVPAATLQQKFDYLSSLTQHEMWCYNAHSVYNFTTLLMLVLTLVD